MPRIRRASDFLSEYDQVAPSIIEYEKRNNIPPDSLDAIVPEFIPSIPNKYFLDLGVHYSLSIEPKDERWVGNSWILEAWFPVDLLNYEIFIYPSNNIYPESMKKFGNWVYVGQT